MNLGPKDALARLGRAEQATAGEFAGWWRWPRDHFEVNSGPFWHREDQEGKVQCALRVELKHINGVGAIHGGCLLAFADYCLFVICHRTLEGGRAVTLSLSSEFIEAAYEGELIEGTGELIRAGRSILFARGMLTSAGRPLLNFSGTVKRISAPRK